MASSQEKMVQFHISRLKDKNIDVLLRTIEALAQFGADAAEALPVLEQVYRNHENPEVRKAAQKAGYRIYSQTKDDDEQ